MNSHLIIKRVPGITLSSLFLSILFVIVSIAAIKEASCHSTDATHSALELQQSAQSLQVRCETSWTQWMEYYGIRSYQELGQKLRMSPRIIQFWIGNGCPATQIRSVHSGIVQYLDLVMQEAWIYEGKPRLFSLDAESLRKLGLENLQKSGLQDSTKNQPLEGLEKHLRHFNLRKRVLLETVEATGFTE